MSIVTGGFGIGPGAGGGTVITHISEIVVTIPEDRIVVTIPDDRIVLCEEQE